MRESSQYRNREENIRVNHSCRKSLFLNQYLIMSKSRKDLYKCVFKTSFKIMYMFLFFIEKLLNPDVKIKKVMKSLVITCIKQTLVKEALWMTS